MTVQQQAQAAFDQIVHHRKLMSLEMALRWMNRTVGGDHAIFAKMSEQQSRLAIRACERFMANFERTKGRLPDV